MIKHLFVVTSAINSRFGIYTPEQRLIQTLDTIKSIKNRVPNAGIAIMECTGVSPSQEQENTLRSNCDYYLDYTTNKDVQDLYKSTDNWDVVKNGTEIFCFGLALQVLANHKITDNFDRIHKMSGRYLLNEKFNLDLYEKHKDKIIIGPEYSSQFPYELTLVPKQYMARLWSWPGILHNQIINVYADSYNYFNERVSNNGYVDIEHVLYKFLNKNHLVQVPELGVEGTIAPTGVAIRN